MKILSEFLKRQEEKKIVSRKKYFKYTHKNYWTKHMTNNTVEFWAYSCNNDESWYLGKFETDKITECNGFYGHALPWDVQKGAEKLFSLFQNS